jgi:serine/threonine-protein kinase
MTDRPQAYCPLCLARYDAGSIEFCTRDGGRLRPVESLGQRWEGRTIAGRYQIGRFLGSGGMAEVFEATDVADGHKVALKLIRPQALAEASNVERFRREAQLVAMIDHENVVKVEDYGAIEGGVWYMALELLVGRSLEDALERGPLEPALALEVALQVCDALAAAHAKQIIHRDLKPANIFLHEHGAEQVTVKLLDLGIAKLLGDSESNLTATGMVFGTPEYMSPEQALGKSLDTRSDLYAVGVLLYRLFLGGVPFEADSFVGVLTKQVTEPPRWPRQTPPGIPAGLEAIVMKALEKNPDRRQASVRELRGALETLRGTVGTAIWQRAEGPVTVHARPSRRLTIRRVKLAEAGSALDQEAVELAEGIYWVGRREGVSLERNTYLCTYRGNGAGLNVLIDPGPPKDLATISAKVSSLCGSLEKIDLIFLNHQDPDVSANAAVIQELNPRAHVWCSEDAWRLVHFYGLKPKGYSAVEHFRDRTTALITGHVVSFIPTPYCHFRGAVMYYDRSSRTLFSGDLFGGLSTQGEGLLADSSWGGVDIFHQLYMPSREALRRAVDAVWRLDPLPLTIAPQHGALVQGERIPELLARIEELEVGLDLLRDEVGQESYVLALNEILSGLAGALGAARVEELVTVYSVDGSFPNLVLFDAPLQVASIKIEPRAALCALLGGIARALDDGGRATVGALVAEASARHGLELAPSEWCRY